MPSASMNPAGGAHPAALGSMHHAQSRSNSARGWATALITLSARTGLGSAVAAGDVCPSRRRQLFSAASASLKIIASAVLLERHPLDAHGSVAHVANVLSMTFVTGMRIPVPAHPAGAALVLAYGVTIRDEGHREHVSGQADPYDEP